MVSKEGQTMDLAETTPVQALMVKEPATVGKLRKGLWFISYYRPYIPNLSSIAFIRRKNSQDQDKTKGCKEN